MSSVIDLPRASVTRVLKLLFPPKTNNPLDTYKIAREVKVALARAGGLFVLYLANTANEFCVENKRSTVTAEDVLGALEEIEMEPLIQPTHDFIKAYRKGGSQTHTETQTGGGDLDSDVEEEPVIRPTPALGSSRAGTKRKSIKDKPKSNKRKKPKLSTRQPATTATATTTTTPTSTADSTPAPTTATTPTSTTAVLEPTPATAESSSSAMAADSPEEQSSEAKESSQPSAVTDKSEVEEKSSETPAASSVTAVS